MKAIEPSAIRLYARPSAEFDSRIAHAVSALRAAAIEHPGRIVQSTSLGVEDMVITDLIARHDIAISLSTLNTGMLHAETVALIARIDSHYGLSVQVFEPIGERAMFDSLALRKACCGIRKMEPLSRMLAEQTAWVTGLRREQSTNRGAVPFSELDDAVRSKFNPLADWTWGDVWHYIATHHVPYNPLHDAYMPSIGCAPCTRAIAVGEDFRAGRWWWEAESAKECGLHVSEKHEEEKAVSLIGERA
jgi:phosphoadenosine phosphosulfate reductase